MLRSCCGCCSLRAGCTIIGAMAIVGNLYQLIWTIVSLIQAITSTNWDFESVLLIIFGAILDVIGAIFGALLISGAARRIRFLLWASIVQNILYGVIYNIPGIAIIFHEIMYGSYYNKTLGMMWIVIGHLLFKVISILVIYSYLCESHEEEQRHIVTPATTNISSPV